MPTSLGNIIARRLYVSGTVNPLTGASVYAHPVNVTGTASDERMDETPLNSGYYVTPSEVKHGTYAIKVNGVVTQDTVTVEPGRVAIGIGSSDASKMQYPLIDKVMGDRVRLSSFLADDATSASTQNMVDAIDMSVSLGCELAMDLPCTFNVYKAGSGTLIIDLCGRTLTLSDKIVYDKVYIRNGKISLSSGSQIKQTTGKAVFECIEFIGLTSQQTSNAYNTYIACNGINYDPSTPTDKNFHLGGNIPFGTASNLRLLDFGSGGTGRGRLDALQVFIDSHMQEAVLNVGSDGWLTADKRSKIDAIISPVSDPRRLSLMAPSSSLQNVGFFSYANATDAVADSTGTYSYKFVRIRASARYIRSGQYGMDSDDWATLYTYNTIKIKSFNIASDERIILSNFTGNANNFALKVVLDSVSGLNHVFAPVRVPSVTGNLFQRNNVGGSTTTQTITFQCTPLLASSGVELTNYADVLVYLTLPNTGDASLIAFGDW